jgi:hypothetical protein
LTRKPGLPLTPITQVSTASKSPVRTTSVTAEVDGVMRFGPL